jgi:hypothetical protein
VCIYPCLCGDWNPQPQCSSGRMYTLFCQIEEFFDIKACGTYINLCARYLTQRGHVISPYVSLEFLFYAGTNIVTQTSILFLLG